MNKPITKAIIPVAGWGSRWLPLTKVIEKCMLPIGNRPLIDYIVEDCLKAGISEFIFVVSEQSNQLEAYYRSNLHLNDYLRRNGKEDLLPLVRPINARMHFITQPSYGKYGTAIPVSLATDYLSEGESAVVLMGDDFIYNRDGSSEIERLIQATPEGQCSLMAKRVGADDISKYGIIRMDDDGNYQEIVEKPSPEEAPSDMASIGKYVMTKQAIEICSEVEKSPRGEYELPDAINILVSRGGSVKVVPVVGEHLDGGTPESWLHANNVVCGAVG